MKYNIINMTTQISVNTTTLKPVANDNRNEDLARIEVAVECAILFLAVFGNSVVVFSIFQKRKKMTRMQLLMLHLSTADFFVAFFHVLPQLMWEIYYEFRGDDALCRIVTYLQVVAIYASSYVLVTTAIDRFIAICYPFLSHKLSSRNVHLMVVVAWMLSLLFSIPQMFIFGYREVSPGSYNCYAMFVPEWTEKLYVTSFTVCVYILPTIILAYCYSRICFTVWRSGKVGEQVRSSNKSSVNENVSTKTNVNQRESVDNSNCGKHHGISRAKLRTIKLTMTVVFCYFVCWTPFFVTQLHSVYDKSAPWTSAAYTIFMLLASLNSCTNPWIYLAFSENFGERLKTCFRRCCTNVFSDKNNRQSPTVYRGYQSTYACISTV